MTCLRPFDGEKFKYSHIVGTGGIGSGLFFKLTGDHTLGRNESRLGSIAPFRDYCKMHIIMHYVALMLGAHPQGDFRAFPIGKVGNDDAGKLMAGEMKDCGMTMDHIATIDGTSTLFSVCFQYPDGSGGNITTGDSASSQVAPEDVDAFFEGFEMDGRDGMMLAAPEVPLDARIRLLQKGRMRGSFNAASLLVSEVDEFESKGGFETVDLLAVNIDEAKAIAGITDETFEIDRIMNKCVDFLSRVNPQIMLAITAGSLGSYTFQNHFMEHTPIIETDVIATAGAGDTFLAGMLAGLSCGLPFLKGRSDAFFSETPLGSAVELGTMLAGLAVTSPHTIHPKADVRLLWALGIEKGTQYTPGFRKMFAQCL